MAEEEAATAAPSPVPSDHKRKLEDVEQHPPVDVLLDAAVEPIAEDNDVAVSDSSEAKRPRLDDDKTDGFASENGFEAEKLDEPAKEEEEALQQYEVNEQAEDGDAPSEEVQATIKPEHVEGTTEETEQRSTDNHETTDATSGRVESFEADNDQGPAKEENKQPSDEVSLKEVDDGSTVTRKMEVPNAKVGVLIGKGGYNIKYLQYNSGAKIQIMRDADADWDAPTRPVKVIGTLSSIIKAEKLINAVIAEADAGGSPSLVVKGLATTQASGTAEHIEIQVPNEKVGLIIGRGGETIKGLQTRSGARIQLIPQHLPEGDGSKERTTVWPPLSGGFNQQGYRPRGTTGPPQWGPRGHPAQTASYDYQQRGPYPSQSSHYQPPYGGYPSHQMAPRSNFGSSWEQMPHGMRGPPQSGGYDYYSRQGSISAPHSTSVPGHGPVPSLAPAMGPAPSQSNYNYRQLHGPAAYAHPPPYSQAAPQHSYGHGYEEKYENHTQVQHPYGGHGSSQPGPHPGYAPQQHYGKPPSYGIQSQGSQTYGPPANEPGEIPYQGPTAHSYGPNVPPQQQYPYASSGPMQQSYPPYGSAPPSDGYSQPLPATGQAYLQQGSQPVAGYSQPPAQQPTAYAQASTAAGYGQYPASQQGYSEQPTPNNTGYGYQGAQDPGYVGGTVTTYGAPPPSVQATYAQLTAAPPTYDQSVSQSAGYAAAPGNAPAAYGKTVSQQPGYPQYDSTQMYAAPR